MNEYNLIDNHIKFINLNLWVNDINFNNVDIIECKSYNLYEFITSLIENKVIKCNILIDNYKDRWYYNGKHYYNKVRLVSENNNIYDYLIDSKGNILFWCNDKNDNWGDMKCIFYLDKDFIIENVNKNDLIITYNE